MATKSRRHTLEQSPFYRLGNRSRLATLLGVSAADLRRLSRRHNALYTEFEVEKKSGGKRGVENPKRPLKLVQARVARLLCRIAPPDYLFCPVKRRCYVSNAAQHYNNRMVFCLDIRKYYPSTPARRVFWFFSRILQCSSDVAGLLTALATHKGHLPTGSPLSPILAHYAFYDLWEGIARCCADSGYRLTVYVDDVTISAPQLNGEVLWRVRQAIARAGLTYHKEKLFTDRPAEITGVIVADGRLSVPHRQVKKLHLARQTLAATDDPAIAKKLKGQISGMLGQAAQIRNVQIGNR